MATETTFMFPSGPSESDDSDENESLIYEKEQGHIRRDKGHKVTSNEQRVSKTTDCGNKGSASAKEKEAQLDSEQPGDTNQEMLPEMAKSLYRRRGIVYQLMATSVIVMLHGISFLPYFWNNSLMNIRTLNEQTATQWCVLLSYCISCFYTPSFLYRVQMRWTMAAGCLIAAVFSVARFYPSMYTLIPCGILLGLSLGPFYSAASRNVARLASTYEGYQGCKYEDGAVTFTSVFCACLCFSPVWISLLHIVLFSVTGETVLDPQRLKLPDGECGFYFLWNLFFDLGLRNGLAPELHDVLSAQLGSCLICTLGGIVLAVTFLGDIPFPKTGNALISKEKVTDEVKEVTEKVKDTNLLLLFPVYLCVGMLETFCYTIYVQAFIYCTMGADSIYFSTLVTSIFALVTCIFIGYIARHVSRPVLTLPLYFVILLIIVVLVLATDMPSALYYLIAAVLGITTMMLISQIHAMTSKEFPDNLEVAHALLCLGKGVAYLIVFVLIRYHGDNSTVTGAVMGTCIIAFMCHLILEIRMRLADKTQNEARASGAYVLLEQPRWIPSVDPKSVKNDTKQLTGRIPDVRDVRKSSK